MTISLEVISLASLIAVTVISSFPFSILLFLTISYPYCFSQESKTYNWMNNSLFQECLFEQSYSKYQPTLIKNILVHITCV